MEVIIIKIGDIYYAQLTTDGNVQGGYRPIVIYQNNIGNDHSNNAVVIPLTSQLKRTEMPTHIVLENTGCGLSVDSMALCENPITIPKQKLGKFIGSLTSADIGRIAVGCTLASAGIAFISENELLNLREQCIKINQKCA